MCVCVCVRLCPTLRPLSPPGAALQGILQVRILEWVAISYPGDLPNPGIEPASLVPPALAG